MREWPGPRGVCGPGASGCVTGSRGGAGGGSAALAVGQFGLHADQDGVGVDDLAAEQEVGRQADAVALGADSAAVAEGGGSGQGGA